MTAMKITTEDAIDVAASSADNNVKSKLIYTNYFTLSESIMLIELIHHLNRTESLTLFEKMSTISLDDALNKVINMTKDYLEKKGFRPYVDSDGRYRGYVYYESEGKRKRKPIAAQTLKELYVKAVCFYEKKEIINQKQTFRSIFDDFITARIQEGVCLGTVNHDKSDWIRFMENDPMADVSFNELTYVQFSSWFKEKLNTGLYNRKSRQNAKFQTTQAKNMRSLLTNLCQYAVDLGYLPENYSSKMGKIRYSKYCSNTRKTNAEQVYQDNEPTEAISYCYEQFCESFNFGYLAIIFAFFLDVRVGELVTLTFNDFDSYKKDYVLIHSEETPNFYVDRKTNKIRRKGYIVTDHTKSHKDRFLEITPVMRNLLQLAKEVQKKIGLESDYLFVSPNTIDHRVHEDIVNKILRTSVNPAINTIQKSSHHIRKTGLSNVCSEISVTAAQNRAGHSTPKTTEDYYNFNTSTSQKEALIKLIDSQAPEILKTSAVFSCVQKSGA